jgi:phage recombination protein Bet
MNTNVTVPSTAMDEAELITVLSTSIYPGAQSASIKMALGYCRAQNLDPLQKPVHIVPMWDKNAKAMRDIIMPGIGLYRVQATRTKAHLGTSEPEFGPLVKTELGGEWFEHPEWCKVAVKRLVGGQSAEFTAVEYWLENYANRGKKDGMIDERPNAMWMKRARGQLAKCAEAQALRKGFPELGSAPTAEEMEGKEIDITPDAKYVPRVGMSATDVAKESLAAMDPDEQAFLQEKAISIIALHESEHPGDVFEYVEGLKLDSEETLAIWALLPSKVRASIKKAKSQRTEDVPG